MILESWGRYPQTIAEQLEPLDSAAVQRLVNAHSKESTLIPRGAGRSYGDSALASVVLSSRFLDSFMSFDADTGVLHCAAGVSLDSVLRVAIPKGWFLGVIPGSKFVTVGGAVAADVHGKNHHVDGSFCDQVLEIGLLLASGEVCRCSSELNPDLFFATCAGMGLTGVILDVQIQLLPVTSTSIKRQSVLSHNLDATFAAIEEYGTTKYSVAWLDCLAQGEQLGRSVLFLGEHSDKANSNALKHKTRMSLNVPFTAPAFLLNKYTMSAFNNTYFALQKALPKNKTVNYDSFFFPLDNIGHWNRLYGSKGFLQYQFVVPTTAGPTAIREVLEKVSAAGKGSFLCVLKKFGEANKNLLSFPREGYTLTLDFKREQNLFPLLLELDDIILASGGRLYLAKDARMSEAMFKQSYPNWEAFLKIKQRIDPDNLFSSCQSDRLGLSRN